MPDVHVLVMRKNFERARIPSFFWECDALRIQYIPGRLLNFARPGNEATCTCIRRAFSIDEHLHCYCVSTKGAWAEDREPTDYLCHLRIHRQHSDCVFVLRVISLVLGTEVIPKVRIPHGLVDV